MFFRWLVFIGVFLLFFTQVSFGQHRKRDTTTVNRSDSIIEEVKVFAQKKNIVSRLLRNFIVIERKKVPQKGKEVSEKPYARFEDKIIRNIDVKVLDVFGATINDTSKVARSRFEKAGNRVHKRTYNWVIRQRLLIKSGQKVNPLVISETERVLRQSRNIYDARVIIREIKNNPDSVDVTVIAQDVWSITGSGSFTPSTPSGNLNLRDVNFFGLGNELSGKVYYNKNDTTPWHYTFDYANYNISNTFLIGTLYYHNLPGGTDYGLGLNRDFFSPSIKWAGGAKFNWSENRIFIYGRDSSIASVGYNNNQQDFWLGYGADFGREKKENNFYAAGRLFRTDYTKRPEEDTFRLAYQSNTLYLGSIGYSHRRFIKENYIFGLGRTEDIPVGQLLTATAGYEDGVFYHRPYLGIRAAYSVYTNRFGYFSGSAEWGGYRNNRDWQDAVINTDLLFYSKLIAIGGWRWRNFFWNRLSYGYKIAPGKILNIDRKEGIRGFSEAKVFGNKKYVINYESVFYSPFNLLGFRTAFSFFADFAFIGRPTTSLLKDRFYQAYGIGFRFRNEHLIFRTIQVTLAYYPAGANDIKEQAFKLFEESRTYFQFDNFQFVKPTTIVFQ